jgi:hypothetical protein
MPAFPAKRGGTHDFGTLISVSTNGSKEALKGLQVLIS